ncbi:MAG: response regulator [Candidatus Aminicenantes bacterium]|nr:MAG: response regulator [Candidatus Aminicenantes bacterium]
MTIKEKKSQGQLTKGEGLVLVVDDEPIMRKIAVNVLKSCGYEVMVAEDGDIAVEIFAKNYQKIKLVLLDLLMPRKSGKETYIEMKQIQPDVNVLLVSGAKKDERIKELLKTGVKAYLEKPYTFSHLSRLVHKLIYKEDKKA